MTRFRVLVGEPGETPLLVETGDFTARQLRAFLVAAVALMETVEGDVVLQITKIPRGTGWTSQDF